MTAIYGIDLGTTFTKCALVRSQGHEVEVFKLERDRDDPELRIETLRSAVTVTTRGEDLIAYVGHAAMNAIDVVDLDGPRKKYFEEAKIWIGEDQNQGGLGAPPWQFRPHKWEYRPEDVGALVLRKVQKEVEAARGPTMTRVVITHPQAFGDARRVATVQAGLIAGFDSVETITEPNAAAIAFLGLDARPGRYMIFDLGGGTLDVTIAEIDRATFRVIGNAGIKKGGRNFDRKIFARMVEEYQQDNPRFETRFLDDRTQQAWYELAEATKKALNRPDEDAHSFTYECRTTNFDGLDKRFSLSRAEFLELTSDLVEECVACGAAALEQARQSWTDLDAIVCVGGSTRLVHLRDALARRSERPLRTDIEPDTAVVRGAALYGRRLAQQHTSIRARPSDTPRPGPLPEGPAPAGTAAGIAESIAMEFALPHTLGVKAWSTREQADIIVPLVRRNTRLPHERVVDDKFRTLEEDVTEIEVELYEGERPEPKKCIRLGTVRLMGIAPGRPGPVAVTLRIDENQTKHLVVEAFGKTIEAIIKYDPSRVMPDDELERRQRFISRVEIQ